MFFRWFDFVEFVGASHEGGFDLASFYHKTYSSPQTNQTAMNRETNVLHYQMLGCGERSSQHQSEMEAQRLRATTDQKEPGDLGDCCCVVRRNSDPSPTKVTDDGPPKQPSRVRSSSTLTMLSDNSTIFTEIESESHNALFPEVTSQASYEQIQARERPNDKTPSRPIDPRFDDPILVQRKELVEKFWDRINAKDYKGFKATSSQHFRCIERGAQNKINSVMSMEETISGMDSIFQALPDFKFMYRSIELSQVLPDTLVVHGYCGRGRHTGSPLVLFDLPTIQPSDKLFVMDECEAHFYFDPETNLITRMEEIGLGEYTGFAGFYNLMSQSE